MDRLLLTGALLLLSACAAEAPGVGAARSSLTDAERQTRAGDIRDAALERGLTNGLLLAGIADAETTLAHCWSEATWACQGPPSADCDDGPVIAGAGDGPCSLREGGLGLFQFDAGTFDDTLAREGDRILSIAGNTQAAVDFVIAMVIRSQYVEGVDTEELALAWMNEVRPWNELWMPWIQTVTHYYNGCVPGRCSVYDRRFLHYHDNGVGMFREMGADFWYGRVPPCGEVPPVGGILDETDDCFGAGGDPDFWRQEVGIGHDDGVLWTRTTADPEPANWAFYTLNLADAGFYRVDAHIPPRVAESTHARYAITHGGVVDEVTIDQSAMEGWRELGVFEFAGDGAEQIRVDDNTGEADGVLLAVDAVRLTRVADPTIMPPDPDPIPDPVPEPEDRDGGCAVAPGGFGSSTALPLWLLTLLVLWDCRPRRRR